MASHALSLNQGMVSQQGHAFDRESLAKKTANLTLPMMQTLAVYNFKQGHLVLGSCAGTYECR